MVINPYWSEYMINYINKHGSDDVIECIRTLYFQLNTMILLTIPFNILKNYNSTAYD